MMRWLCNRRRRRARLLDQQLLWPALCAQTRGDPGLARDAFMGHALEDPAWSGMDPDLVRATISHWRHPDDPALDEEGRPEGRPG